ncbi:hypothetical protein MRX96_047629 [Rhipicephalus microplus]
MESGRLFETLPVWFRLVFSGRACSVAIEGADSFLRRCRAVLNRKGGTGINVTLAWPSSRLIGSETECAEGTNRHFLQPCTEQAGPESKKQHFADREKEGRREKVERERTVKKVWGDLGALRDGRNMGKGGGGPRESISTVRRSCRRGLKRGEETAKTGEKGEKEGKEVPRFPYVYARGFR